MPATVNPRSGDPNPVDPKPCNPSQGNPGQGNPSQGNLNPGNLNPGNLNPVDPSPRDPSQAIANPGNPRSADPRSATSAGQPYAGTFHRWAVTLGTFINRKRARQYSALLFAITICMYAAALLRSSHWIEADGQVVGRDYLAFYMAGAMVSQGGTDELYDFAAQQTWQQEMMAPINPNWSGTCLYLNPPHFAWLLSAIARFGYGASLILWWVLSLAAFAATVAIWSRWLPREHRGIALLLAICMPAWFWALAGGQNSFFSLLIMTAFAALLLGRRDFAAGLVLSLMAFKFQFLVVPCIWLVLTRRRRALVGLAVGGVATIAVTASVMGTESLQQYVRFSMSLGQLLQIDGFDVHNQHCWYGMFTLAGGGVLSQTVVRAVTLLATVTSLALMALICGRSRDCVQPQRASRSIALLQLSALFWVALLVSPHLFHYDMLLAVLPAVLWFAAVVRLGDEASQLHFNALMLILFVWLVLSPLVAEQVRLQLSPLIVTGCLWEIYRVCRRQPSSAIDRGSVAGCTAG